MLKFDNVEICGPHINVINKANVENAVVKLGTQKKAINFVLLLMRWIFNMRNEVFRSYKL